MKPKTCPSCIDCGVINGKMVCLATGAGRGFSWNDTLKYDCHRVYDFKCKNCEEDMKPFTYNIYLGELNYTKSVMICDNCGTMHIPSPNKMKDPRG
jgi:hypothetical protein